MLNFSVYLAWKLKNINSPSENDNRDYDYSSCPAEMREEYKIIRDLIPEGSSVLDLACGNGSLLELLAKEKNVTGTGIELADSGVTICQKKGLNVTKGRIDEQLAYKDREFDFAVCNVTIQMVLYPEVLLSEMKRVAKYQIVSFPNFGFIKNRLELLLFGRMPKRMLFGYKWYSTGHIHQLSHKDFYELVRDIGGLRILRKECRDTEQPIKKALRQLLPTLFEILPVFLLTSDLEKEYAG